MTCIKEKEELAKELGDRACVELSCEESSPGSRETGRWPTIELSVGSIKIK